MKKNLFLVLALCLLGAVNAKAQLANLLPKPQIVRTHKAEKPFKLKRSVVLSDATATPLLREVLTKAGCHIVPQAKARIDVEIVDRLPNVYDYPLHGFPCEGYALDITPNKVTIKVLNGTGTIRAAQTLAQMAGEKAELEAASNILSKEARRCPTRAKNWQRLRTSSAVFFSTRRTSSPPNLCLT